MTKQDDVEALLKEAIEAEFKRQVAEQIKDIFASVPEADSGGAKTVIGGVNIHFGGTIWPLLSCGVTIILATLAPSGLTWAAAGGAIWNAVEKLRNVIKKLDPAQRVIYRAILEVAQEKKTSGKDAEASVDEIKSYFTKQGELVPVDLDKILGDLVKNNILSRQNYPAGACYSPVF